jgi:hypothetical protein
MPRAPALVEGASLKNVAGSSDGATPGLRGRLVGTRVAVETATMPNEPAWERDDVEAILGGLFDIRGLLARLVQLVEGDDESEEETDS